MFYKPLMLPLLAQVLLTFIVMLRMYYQRLGEYHAKSIEPQSVPDRAHSHGVLVDSAASSDNFINLFEMPVLFYVALLLSLNLMLPDMTMVLLAWVFVILRGVHSFIHTTYNTVIHRFAVFVASSLVLLGMWVRLGWYIIIS
jgi:hypothetical protein